VAANVIAREQWTPVRYVRFPQRCDFCWETIPRCKPGNSTGTRGTKAYFNAVRRVWECIACRQEGFRAEAERERMDEARAREAGCRSVSSTPAI
jgi:hypothetical protein